MTDDREEPAAPPPDEAPPGPEGIDQEALQRRLEEQLRQLRVQDLLLESVVSILNLAARRIAKADERDLEQGRIGIDAVRAVIELIEPAPREQVREALSQVQLLYARETEGGGESSEGASPDGGAAEPKVERPSGLWTPPGSS